MFEADDKPEMRLKGRGAGVNTDNRFLAHTNSRDELTGIDDWTELGGGKTQYNEVTAASLVNKVESPDVGMLYSMNPYMGCEHGCAYCYARNAHEYLGYSAGIDFEQKIFVKKNAPELLRKFLMKPGWECKPLSLSGNTDCYQPAEQKFRITRKLLEICYEFRQPVGIISKNSFLLNDLDLLQKMAALDLVSVIMTINSLNEDLRRAMEPRTTTANQRLRVIKTLSEAGIRSGVMAGPMIPGLNDHELQDILKAASDNGARFSAYTFVRLNGSVKKIFHEWLYRNFPERADKVWHAIERGHGGKVNDSRFGTRMRGEGPEALMIRQQFKLFNKKYGLNSDDWQADCSLFRKPGMQGLLF